MKYKKGEKVMFSDDEWRMKIGIIVKEVKPDFYEVAFPNCFNYDRQIKNVLYHSSELLKYEE